MNRNLTPLFINADDMAVLLGVPVEDLNAWVKASKTIEGDGMQSVAFPPEWIERGRSRRDVYNQATGEDSLLGSLEFWKAQRDAQP